MMFYENTLLGVCAYHFGKYKLWQFWKSEIGSIEQ